MKLELFRVVLGPTTTIGVLRVDGKHQCFTCEDTHRPGEAKIPTLTAIPCGTHQVVVTHSPRFGVEMPLLLDVPGCTGIRIHPGNTSADTEGCILPGRFASDMHVGESRQAYDALVAKLKAAQAAGELTTITITAV